MMQWILARWGDILVLAALALIVGLVIRNMLRDKKKGNCCGCSSCKGCSRSSACQREKG